MSATTRLIERLASEKRSSSATNGTDDADAHAVDAASDGPSLSEIRAAAKEGTAEALAAHRDDTPEGAAESSSADGTDEGSSGGPSLKRGLLLGVVAVYLLRRRRKGRSADTQ